MSGLDDVEGCDSPEVQMEMRLQIVFPALFTVCVVRMIRQKSVCL